LRLLAHVKAEGWLPPGGVVLDPLAGSGVTGLACSMRGVRSVGGLEAHCLAAFRATVATASAPLAGAGLPRATHAPARCPASALHQIDLVISSPPYPGMVHARNHNLIPRSYAQRIRTVVAGPCGGYGTHPAQIGVSASYGVLGGDADVYRQCYAVLPVGGHLVLVVKGMVRQGRYVDTPTRTAALREEVALSSSTGTTPCSRPRGATHVRWA